MTNDLINLQSPPQFPSFDQIVKGNVSIKKLSKHKYKITFSKIGKFLMYQVWDKDNVNNINDKRIVQYVSAKKWVKIFKGYNEKLENNKPLFTPTTVMETDDDCVYAFVIHKACLNSHDQVVFTVSTKEISLQNNISKKLIQLPQGKCNNVRFDIDPSDFDGNYDWVCIKKSSGKDIDCANVCSPDYNRICIINACPDLVTYIDGCAEYADSP